jgi:hypothetical protein
VIASCVCHPIYHPLPSRLTLASIESHDVGTEPLADVDYITVLVLKQLYIQRRCRRMLRLDGKVACVLDG